MVWTILLTLGVLLSTTPLVGFSDSETRAYSSFRDLGNVLYAMLDVSSDHPLPLSAGRDDLTEPFSEEEEENDVDLDPSFMSGDRDAHAANRLLKRRLMDPALVDDAIPPHGATSRLRC